MKLENTKKMCTLCKRVCLWIGLFDTVILVLGLMVGIYISPIIFVTAIMMFVCYLFYSKMEEKIDELLKTDT